MRKEGVKLMNVETIEVVVGIVMVWYKVVHNLSQLKCRITKNQNDKNTYRIRKL